MNSNNNDVSNVNKNILNTTGNKNMVNNSLNTNENENNNDSDIDDIVEVDSNGNNIIDLELSNTDALL